MERLLLVAEKGNTFLGIVPSQMRENALWLHGKQNLKNLIFTRRHIEGVSPDGLFARGRRSADSRGRKEGGALRKLGRPKAGS
jgi:hypothetical protein